MGFIILEGLDRSGKSTVAEYYKQQGYEVVHMGAPHKKFFETGYAGPSYLEEIVEMYNVYAGKNVVFDRSPWGELIWPEIFNRMPLLNEDDFEYLAQLEYNQDAKRYLMVPSDTEAHWKRCVDNKEPINRIQFLQAGRAYDKLENERNFERKQLSDFKALAEENKSSKKNKKADEKIQKNDKGVKGNGRDVDSPSIEETGDRRTMVEKLDKANAIRSILDNKILKKKGEVFENLEEDIRDFLALQLKELFEPNNIKTFTGDEVIILKNMAQRIKQKME